MAFQLWLGPAGALVGFRAPGPDYSPPLLRLGGTHETLGGLVRDTTGYRREIAITLPPDLPAEAYSALESLFVFPNGPYRFIDPTRRNLLGANQSSGTDALRDATGFSAFAQGVVSSSTAQARSGSRSLAWNTQTALAATARGIRLFTSLSPIDRNWAAVLPSTDYTISSYVRASAAVSMQAGLEWYDAAGSQISAPAGAGVAVGTGDWLTRLAFTATSPSNAAYGVGKFFNTTTTVSPITVFFDDLQLEQAAAASAAVLGTGTGPVTIDQLEPDHSNWYADASPPLLGATLVLLELDA